MKNLFKPMLAAALACLSSCNSNTAYPPHTDGNIFILESPPRYGDQRRQNPQGSSGGIQGNRGTQDYDASRFQKDRYGTMRLRDQRSFAEREREAARKRRGFFSGRNKIEPKEEPEPEKEEEPKITYDPLEDETELDPPRNEGPPAEKKSKSSAPFGVPVPGKDGLVYSPFDQKSGYVDVRDMPRGEVVECPYSGKLFRVP